MTAPAPISQTPLTQPEKSPVGGSEPLRLLLFLDTDHLCGPARLALDFCVEARTLGHQVLILGLVRGAATRPTRFSEAVEAAELPFRVLHERFRFDPAVITQFRQILGEFQPDLYQSHGYKGSLLGRYAQRAGVPWQAVFHGFTWENWRIRLYHALDVRWMRGADEVITVSRAFTQELGRKGINSDRLYWVPNAISEENLRNTVSGENLRESWFGPDAAEHLVVGVVGRFSPEKGPEHFLRAFSWAAQRNPALRAVMVGDGPLLEECRTLARHLPEGDRVVFAGFRADLASVYAALDGLVIPSFSEGMPTVMIEAMLLGVPVVSTRVGAVPDVVRDGRTALLAPIGDETALSEAMLRLADTDLRRRLAEAARAMARARLTVAQRTRTLIEHARCLKKHQAPPGVVWDDEELDNK